MISVYGITVIEDSFNLKDSQLDVLDYINMNGRMFWRELKSNDDATNRQRRKHVKTKQYAFADLKEEAEKDKRRTSYGLEIAFATKPPNRNKIIINQKDD